MEKGVKNFPGRKPIKVKEGFNPEIKVVRKERTNNFKKPLKGKEGVFPTKGPNLEEINPKNLGKGEINWEAKWFLRKIPSLNVPL